jgi:hypothetical protein
MTEDPAGLLDLETAMAAVYVGPLEDFVFRRDQLARQLRAAGRRADADTAKSLRKPSRAAWALDSAVHDDPAVIERLAAAVAAALDVQAGAGGDLRSALDAVRSAARDLANQAARAAAAAGQRVEASSLGPAVFAVIGDASAFALLRAGRLAEIPEGGGLDFLTAAAPAEPASPVLPGTPAEPRDEPAVAVVRADLERAETAVSQARARAQRAQRRLQDAQARLDDAEQQLERAQQEAAARRTELEQARQDVELSATELNDAERAAADARAQVRSR